MRVPSRIASPVLPLLASFLVAACAGSSPTLAPSQLASTAPGGASPSPAASPSPSAAAVPGLLLEVTTEGGFINPASRLGEVPSLVVDDDGRIYSPGASTGGDTQPLVAPVDVRDVGTAGATAIRDAITAAGLDREEAGGGGVAADTGTTVFTTLVDGNEVVNRFVAGPGGPGRPGGPGAPGGGPDGSPGPGASTDPASAAFSLLARLTDTTETWGSTDAAPAPYRPSAYRVFAAPAPDDAGSSSGQPARVAAGDAARLVRDTGRRDARRRWPAHGDRHRRGRGHARRARRRVAGGCDRRFRWPRLDPVGPAALPGRAGGLTPGARGDDRLRRFGLRFAVGRPGPASARLSEVHVVAARSSSIR